MSRLSFLFQDGTITLRRSPKFKIELVLVYDEMGTYRTLQRIWVVEFIDNALLLQCEDLPEKVIEVKSNFCAHFHEAFAFIIQKRICRSIRTLNLRTASIRTELVGMKSRNGDVICNEVSADGIDPSRLYEQLIEARERAKVLESAISVVDK